MNTLENQTFSRQMYNADSELGKMKLQAVKENLYEATTKVVLYTIEMYTKTSLQEWVKTGLIEKIDKTNKSLQEAEDELRDGHIGKLDTTNGCVVINNFVRKDAFEISKNELSKKIQMQTAKLATIDEKESILSNRKAKVESADSEDEESDNKDLENNNDFFDENDDGEYITDDEQNDHYLENDEAYGDDDDDDDDDDSEEVPPSEIELFSRRVESIKSIEELENLEEEIAKEKSDAEKLMKELNSLKKSGANSLENQFDSEIKYLENLRTLRNSVFAHKNEDLQEISLIGTWNPEPGPLYKWADEILLYIKIIEKRYKHYAYFDEFYASKEGKDKFDGCKVYVQRQIKELYVNRSSIVFEFAGDLYDKEDEEYNFNKLIENMAISWDTGIRYLTVVTNEDLPELNVFFKECLSGTNKYVDYYLIDRNALRLSCKQKNAKDTDYIYFNLIYHLNPSIEKIYWRNKSYTKKEFARQVIYGYIKVKNMFQFGARLKDPDTYTDGIDIQMWCEHHLLSKAFFAGKDDQVGYEHALEMENAIIDFCRHGENKGRTPLYRRAIKASVQLYFYMGSEYVFSYTRSNGHTLHWRSLDEARNYMENSRWFKSYAELSGFVDELYKSDYYKVWRKHLKKLSQKESGV